MGQPSEAVVREWRFDMIPPFADVAAGLHESSEKFQETDATQQTRILTHSVRGRAVLGSNTGQQQVSDTRPARKSHYCGPQTGKPHWEATGCRDIKLRTTPDNINLSEGHSSMTPPSMLVRGRPRPELRRTLSMATLKGRRRADERQNRKVDRLILSRLARRHRRKHARSPRCVV
jgi:hypothetical protein